MNTNMGVNKIKILEPFDKLLKSVNENKNILVLILILLGIYYAYYSDDIAKQCISLFESETFRLVIFMVITYIASSSPAIGISLAIIMLASLQLITYIKLKKELDLDIDAIKNESLADADKKKEKFGQIEPADMSYLNDEYLNNPLEKIDQLAPPINFNLKFTTPSELSNQMIKQGKMMLNDSLNLEQDLKTRYDSREQQIMNDTKKNGSDLVNSGLNRLQKANYGEYNKFKMTDSTNSTNKFVKYSNLMKNDSLSNSQINASYDELLYNYDLLTNKQMNEKEFNIQLKKVYIAEFNLLKNIYESKKSNYSNEKQQQINNAIKNISNLLNQENINLIFQLEQLYLMMV